MDMWSKQADGSLAAPPRLVPITDVEAELARLWSNVETVQTGIAAGRAALLNLVILCPTRSAADEARQTASLLSGSHPSRTFVVVTDHEQAGTSLQAWVSARCTLQPGGARQVCCEEVLIAASGGALEFAAQAISPLFLPDLPAFLWLTSFRPEDFGLAKRFAAVCDKLIWDTDELPSPVEMLPDAARLRAEMADTAVGDLAWVRTSPLRRRVAEEISKTAQSLGRVDRVRVSCAPDTFGGALLIAGWLASALGWDARIGRRSSRELIFTVQRAGAGADLAPAEIAVVCDPDAPISVTLSGATDLAVAAPPPAQSACGPGTAGGSPSGELASLLCLALESHAREAALDRALAQAAAMLSPLHAA